MKTSGSIINSFCAIGHFLYPFKTSENQSFPSIFRGFKKKPVTWNWLIVDHQGCSGKSLFFKTCKNILGECPRRWRQNYRLWRFFLRLFPVNFIKIFKRSTFSNMCCKQPNFISLNGKTFSIVLIKSSSFWQ